MLLLRQVWPVSGKPLRRLLLLRQQLLLPPRVIPLPVVDVAVDVAAAVVVVALKWFVWI